MGRETRDWLIIRIIGSNGAGYKEWIIYRHYKTHGGAKRGLEKLRQKVEKAVRENRAHPDRLKSFYRDYRIIEVVNGDICRAMREAGIEGKLVTTGRYARASLECQEGLE